MLASINWVNYCVLVIMLVLPCLDIYTGQLTKQAKRGKLVIKWNLNRI